MSKNGVSRAAAGLLFAAIATLGWAADDPHSFLSEVGECLRCHVDVPSKKRPAAPLRFRKDLVSLCLDCHLEKDLSALHPVDIRPGVRVPEDLPLDEYGTMTCVTCHDPHAPYETDEPHVAESLSRRLLSLLTPGKKHRTFYLRRRNDQGQLCLACHDGAGLAAEGFHVQEASILDQYAGSAACKPCHYEVYQEWQKTPHARMARDAREDPRAVLADFDDNPPFPREAVLFALGSHWTQRYVVSKRDKLHVKAPIWSIPQEAWDTSYWIDKPWAQYCQGCHTTGFEAKDQPRYVELGVGCEACHGPARMHAENEGVPSVVNPADLDPMRRVMVCESCHTTGHDRTGQFRFPLGYLPGKDLTHYYKGLLPKPGQDNDTFMGDETHEDRHRQWRFWVDTFMVQKLSCDVCKNFRSRLEPKEKPEMSPSEYCLTCHEATWPKTGLHELHLEGNVHCHRCHVPKLAQGGEHFSIHDHKFLFIKPEAARALSPREACSQCHRAVASSTGQ
jgi:hypothetical protein